MGVIGRILLVVLGWVFSWVIGQAAKWLTWAGLTYVVYKTELGYHLIRDFLQWIGWNPDEALVIPAFLDGWDEILCAANAWVPFAELWIAFKVYLSLYISSIPVRWIFQIRGGGGDKSVGTSGG